MFNKITPVPNKPSNGACHYFYAQREGGPGLDVTFLFEPIFGGVSDEELKQVTDAINDGLHRAGLC